MAAAEPAIVRLVAGDRQWTGVMIEASGLILTTASDLGLESVAAFFTQSGFSGLASLIGRDDDLDLALLGALQAGRTFDALEVRAGPHPRADEDLALLQFTSVGVVLDRRATRVASVHQDPEPNGLAYLQLLAFAQAGTQGGVVVDSNGTLRGLRMADQQMIALGFSRPGEVWAISSDTLARVVIPELLGGFTTPEVTPTPSPTPTPAVTPCSVQCATFSIPLTPGWSLISLPRDPVDTSLGSVFSGTTVSEVITWTAEAFRTPEGGSITARPSFAECQQEVPAAGCLRAVRQPGQQAFAGSLTEIRTDKAYWVFGTSFATIRVTLDFAPTFPIPQLHPGWNVVPIQTRDPVNVGTRLDANETFGTANWAIAYSFITPENRWERLSPGEGVTVVVGRGYYLWVNS